MAFGLNNGVRVNGNDPIDYDRYIAVDIAQRDRLVTEVRSHEGLQCYVEADKTLYILKGPTVNDWEEVGGGVDLTGFVDLTTDQTIAGEKTFTDNPIIQNTGSGAAMIVNRTDGKATMLQAALNGSFFAYDDTGYFSIMPQAKSDILTGAIIVQDPSLTAYTNNSIRFGGVYNATPYTADRYLFNGSIDATEFNSGGPSSSFVKGDGSLDSSTYLTSASLLNIAYENVDNNFTVGQTINGNVIADGFSTATGTGTNFFLDNGTTIATSSFMGIYNTQNVLGEKLFNVRQEFQSTLEFKRSTFRSVIDGTLTANRTLTFPDASGTLALIEDFAGYVDLVSDQTIAGNKTFTDSVELDNTNLYVTNDTLSLRASIGTTEIKLAGYSAATNQTSMQNGLFIHKNGASGDRTLFRFATGSAGDYNIYLPYNGGTSQTLATTQDIANIDLSAYVTIAGDETITGIKTFSNDMHITDGGTNAINIVDGEMDFTFNTSTFITNITPSAIRVTNSDGSYANMSPIQTYYHYHDGTSYGSMGHDKMELSYFSNAGYLRAYPNYMTVVDTASGRTSQLSSSSLSLSLSGNNITTVTNDKITFKLGTSFLTTLSPSAVTAARTLTMPDKSGTLAILDDIVPTDLSNYVTLDGTETITGLKTFSSALQVNAPITINTTVDNAFVIGNTNPTGYSIQRFNAAGNENMVYFIAYASGHANDGQFAIKSGDTGGNVAFYAGSTSNEVMRVNHNSRVGINKIAPAYDLDVTGTIQGTALRIVNGTADQVLLGNGTTTSLAGIGGGDLSNYVTLDGIETITGAKTFSNSVKADKIILDGLPVDQIDGYAPLQALIDTTNGWKKIIHFETDDETGSFSIANGNGAGGWFSSLSSNTNLTSVPAFHIGGNQTGASSTSRGIISLDARKGGVTAAATDIIFEVMSGWGTRRFHMMGDGDSTFTGTVSATNLSGTNTGDQDISGIGTNASNLSSHISSHPAPTNRDTRNQIAGSYIGGSGSTNYIPKFTGSGTIGNSSIYESSINGNVGIGTTSPSEKLEVIGSVLANGGELIATTANNARIKLNQSAATSANTRSWDLTTNTPAWGTLAFRVANNNSTEASEGSTTPMVITYNGNVGIGTISPNRKLDVANSVNGEAIRVSSLYVGGAHVTTVPYGSFEVYSADGSGAGAGVRGAFRVYSPDTGGGAGEVGIDCTASNGTPMEAIRIKQGGYVGIGTTTPYTRLSINASTSTVNSTDSKVSVYADASSSYGIGFTQYDGFGVGIFAGNLDTPKVTIESSGSVGIGTAAPSSTLEVAAPGAGGLKISDTTNGYSEVGALQLSAGNGGFFRMYNAAGTNNVLVRSYGDSFFNGGNVGIGITIPSYKLDVSGSIRATSFLESSLRELKTNIKPFEKSGLDIINSLDIVEYNKKDNLEVDKIGIIIDDSPEEVANEDHTSVDLYKTIFVQAKAIQELTERLEKLEKLLG